MSKRRVFALLALVVLVASACASSGEPSDYDDAVQDNFVSACLEAEQGEDAIVNVDAYCGCTFIWFRQTMAYPDFKGLNNTLRDRIDDGSIRQIDDIVALGDAGAQAAEIFRRCEADDSVRPSAEDLLINAETDG